VIESKVLGEELDNEWVQLIREAKNLGIEMDEIRNFLSTQGTVDFNHNT
jgi:DNA-binding transcriptional MerR regulator